MANRFLVAGGTGNWNSTTNWASTSGGSSGASFPVAGDVVALDSLSGNAPLTVNVASACASFVMSGTYAGTLTYNSTLTITSTYTTVSACTIAGTAGTLIHSGGGSTFTSGGKTLTCALTMNSVTSPTHTLADNWAVNGLVSIGTTSSTHTINGVGKTLTCNGGFNNAGASNNVLGTAKVVLAGGTWSSTSTGALGMDLDLNGSSTASGAIAWGASGKTLTYVSGTITTTGSTLTVSTATTLAVASVTWANVTLSGAVTYTLSSNLAGSGTLTLSSTNTFSGAGTITWAGTITATGTTITLNNTGGITTAGTLTLPNAAQTWAGSSGFSVGTLTTATLTASRTYTLTVGNTYTVTSVLDNTGTTTTIRQALKSSSAGTRVVFNVNAGAVMSIIYCDPTDIDSSGGATVVSGSGVIINSNSLNWSGNVIAGSTFDTSLFPCGIGTS